MAIPVIESVVRLVEWSRQHAAPVVLLAIVMTGVLGFYAAGNLGIDTDSEKLLSDELPWRQREIHFDALFPQNTNLLAVVIDGETVGLGEKAAATLADWMRAHPELFTNVRRPDGGPFFDKNGLLYLKSDELQSMSDQLITAQPLIGTLAADPSLRGLFDVLGLALDGVAHGDANLADFEKPIAAVTEATESVLAGHPQPLAWQVLLTGRKPSQQELRRFILAQPTLDYGDLRSGGRASDALRAAARDFGFTVDRGVRVRLTGPVALSEEEFASVAKGAGLAMVLSCTLVCLILFVAVRSLRVIAAILVTLIIGLVWTAAYAAAVVHTLNLLSVAFAVLFVGIAVDFSIQFSVRYRDERYRTGDFAEALARTARRVGGPLLLAAAGTAAGFLSLIPTAYRGLSELGLIAGSSMLIAIFLNLTVLPAILTLLRPKGERAPVGFVWAAPIDGILLRRRGLVMFLAGLLAVVCLVAAPRLHFDFNPLHLKDPHTESMATLLDLMADPLTTPFTVETLTPQPDAAARLGRQLEQLPEVAQAVSIESYVPDDQETKLAILSDLNLLLGPTLSPPTKPPPPNDQDVLASIRRTIDKLDAASGGLPPEAPTRRLGRALTGVIADPDKIAPLDASLIGGLEDQLDSLRAALSAGPVTLADLPTDLKRERYLIEFRPILVGAAIRNKHRGRFELPGSALWISRDGTKMQRRPIHKHITRLTNLRFGHSVNPHLFRDSAATSIALADPEHVRITQHVLGHSTLHTSEKYYNHAHSVEASRRYQQRIDALRRQSGPN